MHCQPLRLDTHFDPDTLKLLKKYSRYELMNLVCAFCSTFKLIDGLLIFSFLVNCLKIVSLFWTLHLNTMNTIYGNAIPILRHATSKTAKKTVVYFNFQPSNRHSFIAVSFGYILNGFFVGWSSKFFSFDEELSDSGVYVSNRIQFEIENSSLSLPRQWHMTVDTFISLSTVSSLSNIVDHFGLPTWRCDCIASSLQVLLSNWNKILAAQRIFIDFTLMDAHNIFRVNWKFKEKLLILKS